MLVACRLASLSALEAHYAGVREHRADFSKPYGARFTDLTASGRMSNIDFARAVATGVKLGRKPTLKSAA
jgi:hypothetical protein